MTTRIKIYIGWLLLCLALGCFAAVPVPPLPPAPDDVNLAFDAPTNWPPTNITICTLYVGTNSGTYTTNYSFTVTNLVGSVTNVFKVGQFTSGVTNYLRAKLMTGNATNATQSFTPEIRYTPLPGNLRMSFNLWGIGADGEPPKDTGIHIGIVSVPKTNVQRFYFARGTILPP